MLKTLLPLLIVASCTWAAPAAMKKTAMKIPCFQGDVILPEGYEVKPNSCLFISFKENIQCDGPVPCHNPDLASIKIENPVFVDGKLRYRADITTAQRQHRDNDVLAIAQLSNGYCKTTGAWVRDGDLYQEFADSFLVKGATFGHVEHDIKLDVYEEPEMMADVSQHHKTFEEPCFHGDVILPKGFELKTGSCLFIRFQEALQCIECEIPTFASVEMKDLVVKDNKIAYKAAITIKPTDPRVQSIAYLSNGHCKDSAYKNGDLHQEYADEFDLGKNLDHLEHDIKLDVYKAQKAHYGEEEQEQQEEKKEDEDFEEQERCDKPCTRELSPVCGTDGVTYPNKCVFNNAKCSDHSLQFAYDGKCKDCPKGVEEVDCDVDPCLQLFCDDVRTAVCKPNKCGTCKAEWFKDGKKIQCEKPKCSEVCPFNYDPQCGSDGVTYGNLCSLETAQCKDNSIRLQSEGECPLQDAVKEVECEEGVPHVSCGYEPCAQLYCKSRPNATCVPNFCGTCKAEWFEQGEKVKCEETVCSEICTLEYEPYCGSDGVTYPNLCTLKTAQCKDNSIVNFGQGACEEREQTPVECVHACTANYKPVCGSDGATYSNKCEFENARCSDPELRIRNRFTCQDDIKETPQGKEVKIHGAVVLPPFTVLKKGSCLKMEVIKNIMCESCENPPLATLEVKNPEANSDGGIAYRMKFVLKEGAVDDFTITATVNNGWCPEDQSEWIRNGDFKNAKAEHINSKTLKLNIVMEKYIQPAASPQQGGIRLHGIVNLPTGSEGLKKESCLKVNVRPDILCVGPSCNISLIKEIVLNNVAGQTEIPYEIILPALTGKFRVSAVANDGWCGNNDEWIRTGDYLNDSAHLFDITAQSTHVTKDVELIKNVN